MNESNPKTRVGAKFGMLTIVRYAGQTARHYYYLCRCECGHERRFSWNTLAGRRVQSCGCLRRRYNRHKPMPDKDLVFIEAKRAKGLRYTQRLRVCEMPEVGQVVAVMVPGNPHEHDELPYEARCEVIQVTEYAFYVREVDRSWNRHGCPRGTVFRAEEKDLEGAAPQTPVRDESLDPVIKPARRVRGFWK